MEVHAANLGGGVEPLRIAAEEQHRCSRQLAGTQHVQVGEDVGGRCFLREREQPLAARPSHESRDHVRVNIAKRCAGARLFLEAPILDGAAAFEVVHETVLQEPEKLVNRPEAAADQLSGRLADQRRHPRLAVRIVVALDEDQTWDTSRGGPVKLQLRRREPSGILETIVVAENADIDGRPVDLLEVELVGPPILRRQLLE